VKVTNGSCGLEGGKKMQQDVFGLRGKHVFVSGASGGIGLVTAQEFLRHGAKVTLHYNTKVDSLKPLIKEYPTSTFAVQARLEDEAATVEAIKQSVASLGPINVVIANHGVWPEQDVLVKDMTLAQWNSTIQANLTSSFLLIREFLRQIEKFNVTDNVAIVMIGSTAGKFGEAYHADYASTKSAMMSGLLYSLKNEIVKTAPRGRVNVVAPGWVGTPMAERAMQDMDLLYQALASSPLKKVSTPLDIARAIVFLASEQQSGNITGHVIDVNAGMEGRLLNKRSDFTRSKL